MANNANLVGVGAPAVTGAISVAPLKTAIPEDLIAELPSAFKDLGYTSDDGLTIAEDTETNEINAWGGKTVKTIVTKFKTLVTFKPIEVSEAVLKEQYGEDNVAVSTVTHDGKTYSAIVAKHTGATLPAKVLVVRTTPADNMFVVYVAKNAQLTERGDLSLNDSDPMGREMTYTCNKDDEGVTVTQYVYVLAE